MELSKKAFGFNNTAAGSGSIILRYRNDCLWNIHEIVTIYCARFGYNPRMASESVKCSKLIGYGGHPALWIGLAILGLVGISAAAARKVRKDPAARG